MRYIIKILLLKSVLNKLEIDRKSREKTFQESKLKEPVKDPRKRELIERGKREEKQNNIG